MYRKLAVYFGSRASGVNRYLNETEMLPKTTACCPQKPEKEPSTVQKYQPAVYIYTVYYTYVTCMTKFSLSRSIPVPNKSSTSPWPAALGTEIFTDLTVNVKENLK
jgi:hypothetical protein